MGDVGNPYAGIADSFSKGQESGERYATGMFNVQNKMQEMARQQAQFEETQRQHKFEVGKWMTDETSKILDVPAGKTQNWKIENFRKQVQVMGYPDPEGLAAMMTDPTQVAKMRALLYKLNSDKLPDSARQELLVNAADTLTDKEIVEKLKDADNNIGRLIDVHTTAEEARKTEAAKHAQEKPLKNLEQEKVVRTELEKYHDQLSTLRDGYANLQKFKENPSGFQDVGALYTIVKMFDPNSTVREGEIELSKQASSLPDKIKTFLKKATKDPRLLTNEQLSDISNTAGTLFESAAKTYEKKKAVPLRSATAGGLDESKVDPGYEYRQTDQDTLKKIADDRAARKNSRSLNSPLESAPAAAAKQGLTPPPAPEDVLKKYQRAQPKLIEKLMRLKAGGKKKSEIKSAAPYLPEELYKALGIE